MAQRYFAEETLEYPPVADVSADERLRTLEKIEPPPIRLDALADLEGTRALLRKTGVRP